MDVQEYLEQIKDLEKKIDSKLRERRLITRLTKQHEIEEETGMKLRVYDEEVNDYVDELLCLQIKIADEIMQLEDFTHQMVLRERYLHSKKWEQIAEEQHYEVPSLHRLHNKALEKFGEVLKDK